MHWDYFYTGYIACNDAQIISSLVKRDDDDGDDDDGKRDVIV